MWVLGYGKHGACRRTGRKTGRSTPDVMAMSVDRMRPEAAHPRVSRARRGWLGREPGRAGQMIVLERARRGHLRGVCRKHRNAGDDGAHRTGHGHGAGDGRRAVMVRRRCRMLVRRMMRYIMRRIMRVMMPGMCIDLLREGGGGRIARVRCRIARGQCRDHGSHEDMRAKEHGQRPPESQGEVQQSGGHGGKLIDAGGCVRDACFAAAGLGNIVRDIGVLTIIVET